MDFAVWNTLHDGSIESLAGSVPGDVQVRIGIEYLCEKLPTTASHVTVHLRGCAHIEYETFARDTITSLQQIAGADIEVLSASESGGLVVVTCAGGLLRLAYDRVEVMLAEGETISQAELESSANQYWTEWEANARREREQ